MPTAEPFSPSRSEIAGVPIADLVRQFGTPAYVYDAAKIVERIDDLRPFDVIRYAQKACSNIAILDLVRRHGVVVDAVSAGEVHRALKAGYRPGVGGPESGVGGPESGVGGRGTGDGSKSPTHPLTYSPTHLLTPHPSPLTTHPDIVYTADIFDREALDLVVELGIPVNCGSPDMIDQLGERAPGRNITLRINPGFGHGHSQKTNTGGEQSKHGIWHEQLDDCLQRADRHGLMVAGLHMHIGSGTDLAHLRQVCGAMERAATAVGRSITTISAGGGLPIPYRADQTYVDIGQYFELWDATRQRLAEEFGHPVSLEIEPGRYLVAESGYLIAEIRAVKQMGANTFYLLDAGFNNLARPILYGAYHPMSICHAGATAGVSTSAADGPVGRPVLQPTELRDVVVGGPLCESGDIFTQEEGGFVCQRPLPAAGVGDWLIIERAGAYGFVMASNYNSKPLPPEVLIHSGQPHLIRSRQTLEDLVRGERIPSA